MIDDSHEVMELEVRGEIRQSQKERKQPNFIFGKSQQNSGTGRAQAALTRWPCARRFVLTGCTHDLIE
ncbi:MAG TPA: hypothetical protein VF525_16360 [Pyrinomonadaceae bacterium]|jgi:hypothetical protein